MRTIVIAALLGPLVPSLAAQSTRTVQGVVLRHGAPAAGANVFVLETLDGAIADSAGRFRFSTSATAGTLVVQCLRCIELRVPLNGDAPLRLEVQENVVALPALQVGASRFSTGNAPDAELSALAVVRTPGAAADVYRALQTFPGLQSVDEGAGLFVRGGDVSETRVFVNDAVVLSPYKHESPTGGFFGAFDPFLLDGIQFSSGGFGAEHGDALSGVAALRTLGRPAQAALGATISLAAVSGSVALPLSDQLGARATYTRSHTELMFRVNGTDTEFTHVPEGRDASLIAEYTYGRASSLRLFAIDQWSELGVFLQEPSFDGALDAHSRQRAAVLTWRQDIGNGAVSLALANATSDRDVQYGALDLTIGDRLEQLGTRIELPIISTLRFTAGGELQRRTAAFTGSAPRLVHDLGTDAPADTIAEEIDGTRTGTFAQWDWSSGDVIRVIAGLRTDAAELTDSRTVDPRLSVALRIVRGLTLTAAWGHYHQVPDPALFEAAPADGPIGVMRAEHRVLGAQWQDGEALVRVEAFDKRYRNLAELRRDRLVDGNGTGTSRGVDVFLRWPDWHGFTGRTSYSYLHARRTDPDTRRLTTSPYDITHVLNVVVERSIARQIHASGAYRYATGRPVTPITAARYSETRDLWEPIYGPPFSERLPAFHRVDVSLSRLVPLPRQRMLVLFLAANNILDRKNSYAYRYSDDYRTRTPVRSEFRRSIYFGASIDL